MKKKQVQVFLDAISDPIRLKLLDKIFQAYLLYSPNDNPSYRGNCVTELRKSTKLSQPTISHHLKILEDARILTAERQGKWIHYLPDFENIDRYKNKLNEFFSFDQPKQTHLEAIHFDSDEKKLKALVDLLANHDIHLKHFTKRQSTFSIYLQDKGTKDNFLLLQNQDTKILTVRLIGESNMIASTEVLGLIKKYISTL
ncbi:ArsR family transcriptional regulator [Candidatus Dojkabacteria bacterium]|nr:ArsR family transcriptional regulator [Candidatus Dojkabacteria bacterium]